MLPPAAPARTADALAAAREVLPAWVVWGRVVATPILLLLAQACLGSWVVLLLERSAGPQSGVHWSERARRIANLSAPSRAIYWAIIAPAIFVPALLSSELDPVPAGLVVLVTLALSLLLGAWMSRSFFRQVYGAEMPARAWGRARLTTLLMSRVPQLAILACLLLVDSHPGRRGVLLLCLASALTLLFSRGLGWYAVKALGLVERVDVHPLLGESAEGTSFYVFDSPAVVAYALPPLRAVMFSRRAREVLSAAELAAVLQHELGHIAEPRRVRALRGLPVFLGLSLIWMKPLAGWFDPQVAIAIVILGFLAAALAGRRSTKLEAQADAHACAQIEDPRVYARALEKLGEANLLPAVSERETTHPHLYDRMIAASLQPAFPRPAPPRTTQPWWILLCIVVCIELGTVDAWTRPSRVPLEEHALLRALALGGWDAEHLRSLAILRAAHGNAVGALRLREAAREIEAEVPQAETGSLR